MSNLGVTYRVLFGSRGGGGGGGFTKGGGGHFVVKEGHPDFFTNNMIFLECSVIALFEFYMFRDHKYVKRFEMLNDFISSCSAQVKISQEVAK